MRTSLLRLLASLSLAGTGLGSAWPALAQADIVVIGADLQPARLEVPVGTTVTWRNSDDERHRMRSRAGPEEFDSGNLEPGEAFSFAFDVAGTYPYLDERNDDDPAYAGSIVVVPPSGTAGSSSPSDGSPLRASVSLIDESFRPGTVELATGGTVTWTNDDGDDRHTVTASDGAFDSGILEGGATFSHTFIAPGTYPYACLIHPEMQGSIIVSGPALSTAATEASPTEAAATPTEAAATPEPLATAAPAASPAAATSAPSSSPASAQPATSPSAPPASAVTEVHLAGRAFTPADVSVPVGSTVRWLNDDDQGHTVSTADGAFDSGILTVGSEFEHTFDTPGTYPYFCAIHSEMQGTVTVTE